MPRATDFDQSPTIEVYIQPGDATPADISQMLEAVSDLYRAFGGTGLEWTTDSQTEEDV